MQHLIKSTVCFKFTNTFLLIKNFITCRLTRFLVQLDCNYLGLNEAIKVCHEQAANKYNVYSKLHMTIRLSELSFAYFVFFVNFKVTFELSVPQTFNRNATPLIKAAVVSVTQQSQSSAEVNSAVSKTEADELNELAEKCSQPMVCLIF